MDTSSEFLGQALGSLLLCSTLVLKIPLIYNCWKFKSTEGLVETTFYFEILAVTGQIIYNYSQGFPISAWVELISVLVQDFVVVLIIWTYRETSVLQSGLYTLFLSFYVYIGLYHLPKYDLLWILPAYKTFSTLVVVLPQILRNFQNGHTGPLSLATQFMVVLLRCIRVHTALFDVKDFQLCVQYCVSLLFHVVLFFQIIFMYQNTKKVMSVQKVAASKANLSSQKDFTSSQRPKNLPVESSKASLPQGIQNEVDETIASLLSAAGDTEDGWNTSFVSSIICVQQNKLDPFYMRVRALLDSDVDTAFHVLSDITRRPEWDETTEEASVVERYNHETEVVYVKIAGLWPVSSRDIVLLLSKRRLDDGRLLVACKSTHHQRLHIKNTSGVVRAESKLIGALIETPNEDFRGFDNSGNLNIDKDALSNKCFVTYMMCVDPKGNIPTWMVSAFSKQIVPSTINTLNDLLKAEPKAKEWNPDGKDQINQEQGSESEIRNLKLSIRKLQALVDALSTRVKRMEMVSLSLVFFLFILSMYRKIKLLR